MKYLSLFSGIGGFELGIQYAQDILHAEKQQHEAEDSACMGQTRVDSDGEAGLGCIGFSEIDKYATEIYQKHFPNHKSYGDITKIDEKTLPDFDLLVGGFPCQSFSIAGKRGGFDDTRGTMFFEIARIVREKQPRLLMLENVKGLLSHDKGQTFRTIISTLDELGYDCQWQVLNSKNHGVPQNRERVFIIGHLRGTSRPEVFPFGGTTEQTANDIKQVGHRKGFATNMRTYDPDGISGTLDTAGGGGREVHVRPVLTPDRLIKRQNGRRMKEDGEPSFTLTAQDRHGVSDGASIRRLTPTECERLQGFPDGWTEGVSDTQRYKTLGNAVTVDVIRDIMERLL